MLLTLISACLVDFLSAWYFNEGVLACPSDCLSRRVCMGRWHSRAPRCNCSDSGSMRAGEFKTPNSGLTYKGATPADAGKISSYKVHDRDPLLFHDGFVLSFRNGEVVRSSHQRT